MPTETPRDTAAIAKKLKERALACPWVPLGVPPWQHYHVFPNGLSICFTLDVLPGVQYWHLSIARRSECATAEEVGFWRSAFFNEAPNIELQNRILGFPVTHFYWRIEDGVGEG